MRNLKSLALITIFYLWKVTFSSFKIVRFGLLLLCHQKTFPGFLHFVFTRLQKTRQCITINEGGRASTSNYKVGALSDERWDSDRSLSVLSWNFFCLKVYLLLF